MPGSHVHVQIRETRGSQAARAFGILWYMRLLERVFGLAQFGRAGRFTQVELAVASAIRAQARAGDDRRLPLPQAVNLTTRARQPGRSNARFKRRLSGS
jgi:hypothetical protein